MKENCAPLYCRLAFRQIYHAPTKTGAKVCDEITTFECLLEPDQEDFHLYIIIASEATVPTTQCKNPLIFPLPFFYYCSALVVIWSFHAGDFAEFLLHFETNFSLYIK